MSELIDWAEKAGLENIRFRLQITETLAKEAQTTLTILLAGMGGSLAYAMKGLESAAGMDAITSGAAFLSAWLMISSILLIMNCIMTAPLSPPTNEPKNLYRKDYTLDELREFEMLNLQKRIEIITARNHRVAAWLDRVRLWVAASPLVFMLWVVFWVH